MALIATFLISLLVVLTPLPFGANRPLPLAIAAITVGVALLCASVHALLRPKSGIWRPIGVPLLLFALVFGWIAIQLTPFAAHPVWDDAARLLGIDSRSLTVAPIATRDALLKLMTVFSVGLTCALIGRDARLANILVHGFLVSAFAYALYGVFRVSSHTYQILWFEHRSGSVLTSSFINRNSAATYFGLATVVSFALLARSWRQAMGDGRTGRGQALIMAMGGRVGVYLVSFFCLFSTTLLTGSRGGIAATVLGLLMVLLLMALRRRKVESGAMIAASGVAMLVLLGAILELSGGRLVSRLTATDLTEEGRLAAWTDSFAAVQGHLWTGSGFGTFQEIFPLYRLTSVGSLVWDKAHNDYLELVLGLGLPAALLFFAALIIIFGRCLSGFFERRQNSTYPLLAVAALVQTGAHSLFDFSLQIPAVSIALALLVGLGLAQSVSARG